MGSQNEHAKLTYFNRRQNIPCCAAMKRGQENVPEGGGKPKGRKRGGEREVCDQTSDDRVFCWKRSNRVPVQAQGPAERGTHDPKKPAMCASIVGATWGACPTEANLGGEGEVGGREAEEERLVRVPLGADVERGHSIWLSRDQTKMTPSVPRDISCAQPQIPSQSKNKHNHPSRRPSMHSGRRSSVV